MGLTPTTSLHPVLADAQQFANSLLPQQKTEVSSSLGGEIHHHHYHESSWGPWWVWWHTPSRQTQNVYVNNGSCSSSNSRPKEDKESGKAATIVLLGTVILVVGSFFLGGDLARHNNIAKHHQNLRTQEFGISSDPHREKLMYVINLEHQILNQMDDEAKTGILTKGALLASAAAALAGVALEGASSTLTTYGLIAGGVCAAAIAARWGYSLVDNSKEQTATHLLNTVNLVDQAMKA